MRNIGFETEKPTNHESETFGAMSEHDQKADAEEGTTVNEPTLKRESHISKRVSEWVWLFNVTFNDISVIYVTANRCAGGLKKLNLRSGSHAIDIS